MAKQSSDFILSSLRNRILLAVAALVVFNSMFGLLGYLAVSFLLSEPVYAVVTAVAAMTVATAIFGWWLSNEILRPIEAVSLLARSLERSPSASLPKTTGASETDELLSSLHRNSQQLQNLIGLMDDVASGKTDAAMAPLQNPDRLSVSFQKLVAKVIESIKAKQQLDALQGSVGRLRNDVSSVRSGELNVEFAGDLWQVSEIADAFKFLVGRLSEVVKQAASGSTAMKDAAEEARKIIRASTDAEIGRSERIKNAVALLSESPQRFDELTGQLEAAVCETSALVEAAGAGTESQVASTVRLRSHVADSKKQLDQLSERANAIGHAGRRTSEIVRRSNLLSLNTAVAGVKHGSDSFVGDEVLSLSSKADAIHKEITAFTENLAIDISKLGSSLNSVWAELSGMAETAGRQASDSADIVRNIGRIEAIHSSLKSYIGERSVANDAILKALGGHSQSIDQTVQLKMVEQYVETILTSVETLRDSVADLRTSAPAVAQHLSLPKVMNTAEELSATERA